MATVIKHPVISAHLTAMRDASCAPAPFRDHLSAITSLMLFEVFKHYPTKPHKVVTPLQVSHRGEALAQPPVFIPVLRAGLGMLDAALRMFPSARVGHIGVQRHGGAQAHQYFFKLPPQLPRDTPLFILEPMLATGESALIALTQLFAQGFTNITLISLIAAPPALTHIESALPKLPIFLAALDQRLNADNYIEPGLGDAGDRLFGT